MTREPALSVPQTFKYSIGWESPVCGARLAARALYLLL